MRTIKSIGTGVAVALAIAATPAIAGPQKNGAGQTQVVTLKVPDMFCGGCELAVKMAATKVTGVKNVKIDSDKRIAEVSYDPSQTNADAIAKAITKNSGFKVEVSKAARK